MALTTLRSNGFHFEEPAEHPARLNLSDQLLVWVKTTTDREGKREEKRVAEGVFSKCGQVKTSVRTKKIFQVAVVYDSTLWTLLTAKTDLRTVGNINCLC